MMVFINNLVVQLQSHLSEAMRKLRMASGDDIVDKRVLANLVLGFIIAPRGTSKPFEILNIIANLLSFTDDERVKAGLARGTSNNKQSNEVL